MFRLPPGQKPRDSHIQNVCAGPLPQQSSTVCTCLGGGRHRTDDWRPRPPCGGGIGWGVALNFPLRGGRNAKLRSSARPPSSILPHKGGGSRAPTSEQGIRPPPEMCAYRRAKLGKVARSAGWSVASRTELSDRTVGGAGRANRPAPLQRSTPHPALRATFPSKAGEGDPHRDFRCVNLVGSKARGMRAGNDGYGANIPAFAARGHANPARSSASATCARDQTHISRCGKGCT